MRWKKGRQNTGYEVLTPFLLKGIDCHILRYTAGCFIPPHRDEASNGKHHRINLVLKSCKGGEFKCDGAFRLFDRLFYFKPDEMEHSVTECLGTRYVLSIGWVI